MLVSSFLLIDHSNAFSRVEGYTYRRRLTRLKSPLAIDLHRFLVPLCDLSLGYCANAVVENDRARGATRATNMVEAEN